MDSGWAAILGALVGGLTTWLSAWQIESRRDVRQARKYAIAAASEIDAALVMLRARKWRASVDDVEKHAREGRVHQLSIHNAETYLIVTREALRECSAIDTSLAVLFGRLIMMESSLLSDLRRLANYPVDHPDGLLSHDRPEAAAELYQSIGLLIDAAQEVGEQAVRRVLELYPQDRRSLWVRLKNAWIAFWK